MSDPQRQEVVITDIVSRVVEGKMSATTKKDHWRIVEYEVGGIGRGRGLALNSDWRPGKLVVRLGVSGWYRISFISRYADIRAKLTDDACFTVCNPVREGGEKEGWYDAEDVVWREADLTGQDLIIDDSWMILLAIRLTPVEESVDDRQVRWPMMITHDDGGMCRRIEAVGDLFEWCERIPRDGCVRTVVWMAGMGDNAKRFTKVGTQFGALGGDGWDEHPRAGLKSMELFRQWGVDPIEPIVDYVKRERGWELFFYVRHRGWGHCLQIDGPWGSQFYSDHPEYRNMAPDGRPVLGLSVAYPEVRRHLCAFYRELAETGADGVCTCYVRGVPIVLYEAIMVEGFQAAHGVDPRTLGEDDPRWLDYSAKVVTTWMRELNEAVGPDCKLAAMIHGTRELNARFGMDIETWAAEGIVSDLFIMCHQYDEAGDHSQAPPEFLEYEWFENMPGRENVRLWPMFYPWQNWSADPAKHFAALRGWMESGADGYGVWDAAAVAPEVVANIWDLGKEPAPSYEKPQRLLGKFPLVEWDGYAFNRYTPVEGW